MDFDIITSSLKKGWEVWKDNIVAYVVGIILYVVLASVISGIAFALGAASLLTAILSGSTAGFFGMGLAGLIIAIICFVLILLPLSIGLYYMAIKGANGEKVEIKDLFYAFDKGRYVKILLSMIVYTLVMLILALIPIIGWIIAIFLLMFTLYILAMAPSAGIFNAFKESFNTVKDNLLVTLVALIVYLLLIFIGNLLIIVWIITMPIAMIMLATILKQLRPDIS